MDGSVLIIAALSLLIDFAKFGLDIAVLILQVRSTSTIRAKHRARGRRKRA